MEPGPTFGLVVVGNKLKHLGNSIENKNVLTDKDKNFKAGGAQEFELGRDTSSFGFDRLSDQFGRKIRPLRVTDSR